MSHVFAPPVEPDWTLQALRDARFPAEAVPAPPENQNAWTLRRLEEERAALREQDPAVQAEWVPGPGRGSR